MTSGEVCFPSQHSSLLSLSPSLHSSLCVEQSVVFSANCRVLVFEFQERKKAKEEAAKAAEAAEGGQKST